MRTLVVFDSFFGNTEQIARAVTSNLGPPDQVRTCRIGEVKLGDLARLGCLVVGSPTRGFRPTPAIVNLLKAIPSDALRGVKVAAFDTRFAEGDIKSTALRVMVKFGGYAAAPMAALLKKKVESSSRRRRDSLSKIRKDRSKKVSLSGRQVGAEN